jgi:glycine cleavage system H protein
MKNTGDNNTNGRSRRDFLKNACIIIGGAMLAAPALSSACNNTNTTSEPFYTIDNSGSHSTVALDRLYSTEHIWVKKLGNNVVQIGVTDKMQKLVGDLGGCTLSPAGTFINIGDSFGTIGGGKTNLELISPVSGEITEMDQDLLTYPAVIRINLDPYNNGWMLNIKLSKPAELNDLFAPMYYAYLQTQDWTGPIPAKH